MPEPQNVNPRKFKVINVLYDDDEFSVAHGNSSSGDEIGMRWNGGDGVGYPNTHGHPQWFILSSFIARNVLSSLLTHPKVTTDQYSHILKALKSEPFAKLNFHL